MQTFRYRPQINNISVTIFYEIFRVFFLKIFCHIIAKIFLMLKIIIKVTFTLPISCLPRYTLYCTIAYRYGTFHSGQGNIRRYLKKKKQTNKPIHTPTHENNIVLHSCSVRRSLIFKTNSLTFE